MRALSYIFVASLLAMSPVFAQAQQQNDSSLPRVLIIGDTTYSNHTRELSKVLKGKVEVVYAFWHPDEIAASGTTLQLLDRHLGRIDRNGKPVEQSKWPKWDLIHFNCGLGDLIHRAPNIKTFRVMPIHVGGIRNTPKHQYAKNLDRLVKALKTKAPESQLIWANTTPVRASATNVFEMGSEVDYNQVAAEIMKKHGVPTNDMYSFVKNMINMEKPAGFGADPFHFDKKPIHMPIVRLIEQRFQLQPVPETEEEKSSKQNAVKSGIRS